VVPVAVLVLSALAIAWPDVTLLWVPTVLIVGLAWTGRDVVPLGLVAGALATLRLELAPVALVFVVIGARRRAPVAIGIALAVIAPYAVVRWQADSHGARLAAATITWARVVWPLVIALGVLAFVHLAHRAVLAGAALVATFVACILIYDGREAHAHLAWGQHYVDRVENIEYLRDTYARPTRDPAYERLLAAVPADALVALWIDRPDRLDYSRHRFVDARVPRVARLPHPAKLVDELHAHYLLLEHPQDLDPIARDHAVVATADGVLLVDLTVTAARSN